MIYISGGVARLSSSPKAPNHIFREMGIGSVDVCDVLCLEVLVRFGVLYCDRAAAVCVTAPAFCFDTVVCLVV